MVSGFTNGPGEQDSILARVILMTQEMVLDASLLNIQHYKVRIKSRWSDPEKGVAPSLHLNVVAVETGPSGRHRLRLANLLIYTYFFQINFWIYVQERYTQIYLFLVKGTMRKNVCKLIIMFG